MAGGPGAGPAISRHGVVPTESGGDVANTLNLVECNDCTLARVIQCLQKEGTLPAGYALPGAPFSASPLTLNMVGFRIKGTISNKFDDRLVVFYKPVDLDAGFKVEDAKTVEATHRLNVAAIDGFLGDAGARGQLKVQGGDPELPGQESLSKDKKPCKVHAGWKILRFTITTDPGWEKSASAGGVKVSDAEPNVLGQGRAVLEPGILPASHRVGIHHYNDLKGYVALTQNANFNARRAFTGAHLLAELKKLEGTWEKKWLDAVKKTKPAPEAGPWLATWLAQQLNVLLYREAQADYNAKTKQARSFLREIREKSLAGTRHEPSSLTVVHTLEEKKKDPAKPDVIRTLTITSLLAQLKPSGARTLKDDDILVISDYGGFGINIHHSNRNEIADPDVYNWSEGCQVFKGFNDYKQFRRLYELSKRARCTKRGAKGDCSAPSHPKITVDDLIWHYYSDAKEKKEYEAAGKTADDLLRAKLTGDTLDKQFTSRIKARVAAIAFDDTPGAAPAKKPRFKISQDQSARATSIQKVISEKLLPAKDYDAVRKSVGADAKGVIAPLRAKLEAYVQSDLDESAALKAKYDEKVAAYKAAALAQKKKEADAQKAAAAKAASDAEVAALRKTEEEASVKKKLDKLGTELTSLSGEVSDKVEWTIKDIRKQLDGKSKEFNDDGLEHCDLLWTCPTTFDYVLVEAEAADVKEIDDRFEA